jgi:exoribonuclease-2
VRADTLPLVFPVAGQQERGAHLRVKLGEIDEIALDVHGTVIERLDLPAEAPADDEGGDDDDEVAGPIAIAVDLSDSEAPASENTPA